MKTKRTCCLTILLSLLLNTSFQADTGWKLIRQEDGISIFSHQSPNTFVETVKGQVLIDASLDDLLTIFEDIKNCPKWMYRCKSGKTIKQINIVERRDYIVIDFPWPTWNRDVIIESLVQQDRDTKQVEITFQSMPKSLATNASMVRIVNMKGIMRFTPQKNGRILFTYEVSADPEGRIPKWMVNTMSIDFPLYTLKKVRALAEKR